MYGSARIAALSNALSVPDGGFSVDPRNGQDVLAGYAVAVHPEYERILHGHVSGDELRAFIARAGHALALPGRLLGGWRDPETGRAHLDICVVSHDQSTALTIAGATNQLAVFDLAELRPARCRY